LLETKTTQVLLLKKKIKFLVKKISSKRREIYTLQKKCVRLQKKIRKLKKQSPSNSAEKLTGPGKSLINNFVSTISRNVEGKRYTEDMRKFAVTLHFYSPRAYCYVRQQFNNCLPHPKTLSRWYSTVAGMPGFTRESFDALALKASSSNKKIVCSLVFDEMAIRQHVEYDGRDYFGFVAMGGCLNVSQTDIAKEALVFMVVAINDTWKIPVGYFLIQSITSDQKATLVTQCVDLILQCGMLVANITSDGCPANFTMAKKLGCCFDINNINTSCDAYGADILPDPSHMCKLVRNTFGEKAEFWMNPISNEIIDFHFLALLNDLQENEGLHLANKLRSRHISFFKQKMKVKLATQLLSRSVADALLFCKDRLQLPDFEKCGATIKFIIFMNDAFDILNSRNVWQRDYKAPITVGNIENIKLFTLKFTSYVSKLKFENNNQLILDSARKTGFLGFILGLHAVINIYSKFLEKEKLIEYLPVYKCSQDHLEIFFSNVRSQLGYNDNPTARQFRTAYKKLLIHAEIADDGIGNCVPLEQISILNTSGKKSSEDIINSDNIIYNNNLCDTDNNTDIDYVETFINNSISEKNLSSFSEEIVVYIAGFVAFKLSRTLRCEECVSLLHGTKKIY
jgi:hypothetical protein